MYLLFPSSTIQLDEWANHGCQLASLEWKNDWQWCGTRSVLLSEILQTKLFMLPMAFRWTPLVYGLLLEPSTHADQGCPCTDLWGDGNIRVSISFYVSPAVKYAYFFYKMFYYLWSEIPLCHKLIYDIAP